MNQKKEITATPASFFTSSLTPIILEKGERIQVSFEGMQVDNRGNLNKNIRGKLVVKKKSKCIPSFEDTEKFSRKDISSNELVEIDLNTDATYALGKGLYEYYRLFSGK